MNGRKRRRWPVILAAAVALVVIAAVVALQLLDGWLLQRVRREADVYAQQLGRPIEIRELATRLIAGAGVSIEGITLGPAPGEELPLASVERVDVRAALWPLVRSAGKDIQIRSVEVHRPELTVVRLPDGTTNLDHLRGRLEKMSEETAAGAGAPEEERDLSGVRLGRFALEDGRVRFVDRSGQAAREVAINDLDVMLEDLRVGKPLELTMAAAVLAEKQNLNVSLTSTPLPPSLLPTPDRLVLKAEPIDLSPLAPFLPRDVGFLAGSLDADLTAQLGRAVPGGEGATRIAGVFRAMGLRFRGAEGGKALDITVDSDLSGDVVEGSLDLRKLEIALGPAHISGRGKVKDLASDKPSVQGLEIRSRDLDLAVLARYFPPLEKMIGGQIAGPIGLLITGSGSQDAQAIAFNLDFAQTQVKVPAQLTKAAGAPMGASGTVRGSSKGVYAFDARIDLQGADLRPGEVLNKAPGDPFQIAARGTLQPAASPRDATRAKVNDLRIQLLEDSLNGTASVERKAAGARATTNFELAMKSPRVNADRMLLTDEQIAAAKGSPQRGAGAAPAAAKDPNRFDGLRGAMAFDIGSLRLKRVQMSNVVVRMKMVDDEITLEQLRAGAFGGSITGDGTKIALGPAKRPFEVKLAAKNVELGEALARGNATKKALAGSFNGEINLKGAGYEMENLNEALAGVIQGTLENGSLLGIDVVQAVSEPLAKALPFAAKALSGEGLTKLGDELPFGVTIEKGVAKLKQPIKITRPQAALSFDGGIQLNGDLNLAGTVALTPSAVSAITNGRAKPTEPIPVAMNLSGPAWKPRIGGVDVKPAVAVIAKLAAASVAEKVIGDKLGGKGKAVTEAVKGNPEQLKREAEQKAAEERAKAEARARAEAEKAKQRAEEEAKKRLRGLFGR
ncbi:MAG TPA: AsmA family protein [Myxococcaceae bacterium]|nr:AsmA family protein [Myxococcaceae bacterium]